MITTNNNTILPIKIPRARRIYGVEGYIYEIWQVKQLQYYKISNPTWKVLKQLDRQQPITKKMIAEDIELNKRYIKNKNLYI